MKKLIFLSFVAFTMLNCKNNEPKIENSDADIEKKIVTTPTPLELGCYVFDDGKSLVVFEIKDKISGVIGTLNYSLAEKDKNTGTFSGQLVDDILAGNYTFQSEGIESTRQVAFKVDGDKLIEGYGEMNEDGTTFKDVTKLDFSSKMVLAKTDCK